MTVRSILIKEISQADYYSKFLRVLLNFIFVLLTIQFGTVKHPEIDQRTLLIALDFILFSYKQFGTVRYPEIHQRTLLIALLSSLNTITGELHTV
jgi:hypothetical protein